MMIRKYLSIIFVACLTNGGCLKSYDSLYQQGLSLKAEGKYAESLKSFENAAEKKQTAEVYKEIANYYIEYTRDYDKAENYLNKSLAIDPKYPNARHNMGLVFLKRYEQSLETKENREFLQKAETWFSENLAQNPEFALSYAEYGMILFYKEKYKEAIASINKAMEKGVNKHYAHLLLGKIYFYGYKNYETALEHFNIAYNDFNKDSYLLKMLASTHKNLNHKNESHTYYLKYVKSLQDNGAPAALIDKAKAEEASLTAN